MIIKREQGIINELIYDSTMYHNGRKCFFPSVSGLVKILNAVCQTGATTEYIRVIPFYYNYKLKIQYEFDDDYMFFISCREQVTEEDIAAHLAECATILYQREAQIEDLNLRYPLCQYDDVAGYVTAIKRYIDYLDVLILQLMDEATKIYNLKQADFGYGFVRFEINSA